MPCLQSVEECVKKCRCFCGNGKSRNVDSKINSVFNIRDKSEELHNKSVFFVFIVVRRFVLFIQQK